METTATKPSEAQIRATIAEIQKKLKLPQLEKPVNRAIKEGFTESVNILAEGRTTYDGIDQLSTQQGRAIAVLAVDYLNGETSSKILLGVPFKS